MVEKVAPGGEIVARIVGVGLVIWGGVAIATALSV